MRSDVFRISNGPSENLTAVHAFRIWNIEGDGSDFCPPAQTNGLVLQYVFGESGDIAHDTSGNEKDGDIHDADWSDDKPPSQQCQRQGFGGFFDGDSDYVQLPALGTFPALTVDTWLKFEEVKGNHPVLTCWQSPTVAHENLPAAAPGPAICRVLRCVPWFPHRRTS